MLVYVRKVILNGKTTYEIGEGVSLYTPFTTHYDLDADFWTQKALDTNAGKSTIIHAKIKGTLPPKASFPNPPIKRKL